MIGRFTLRPISWTIGSVKAPRAVDSPMGMVASIFPITSASPMPAPPEDQALTRSYARTAC